MKTTIKTIILAAASLFAAMSCQKEMAGTQDLVKEGETIQVNINASLGDLVAADGTKATATQVVRLTWESGDQVNAYYGADQINTNPISVTPSENGIFAKLTGNITAPSGHSFVDNDIITFVYSNVTPETGGLTFNFSSQDDKIPFVAYATIKYSDLTSDFSDKMVEFKFATSVMKIAATNLGGGEITEAKISGINTKVNLSPSTSDAAANIVSGDVKGAITKTAGFEASSDKTRAIFTVGLVPDNNTGRSITVSQTDYTNKGAITSAEIESSKSYTTPASLFSCGKIGDHDYVLIAGTKWATQNLAITSSGQGGWMGKNEAAVNVPGTTTPVQIGDYFQWGAYTNYTTEENNDKGLLIYKSFSITFDPSASGAFTASFTSWKDGGGSFITSYQSPYYNKTTSQYTHYFDKGAGLAEKDDAARILWEDTWRMPTSAEFKAMKDATYWAWDAKDCGYYVFMSGLGTSGIAGGRENIDDTLDDKTKALLFFPAAGYGASTSLDHAGTRSRYWSSTLYSSIAAYNLYFDSSSVNPQNNYNRFYGFSVRPVSD